jgi:acyl transferase domain-containing protein
MLTSETADHMRELGEAYEALLQPHLKSTTPAVSFFSSVSGKIVSKSGTFDATYWRSNLENPVLFNSAIKLILDTQPQDHLFLEIGPHSALAGPIRQILKANSRKNDTYVTALERGKDCGESVLKMIGFKISPSTLSKLPPMEPS